MGKIGGWESSGFGGRLRAVREEKGLTQKQLAEATGIHPNTIAKMERGEQEPAWPVVLKLAKALGVTCEAFAECEDIAGQEGEEAADEKPATKKGKK